MQEALKKLSDRFGEAIVESGTFRGDEFCVIRRDHLMEICLFLRDDMTFDMLSDICAADYPGRRNRFEVVYHLYSVSLAKRIRIKVPLEEADLLIKSVCNIWKAANWFEREAFDLFGIKFEGHPNLKRILCHHEFEGHPLRKDYPKNRRGRVPTSDPLI